MHNQRARGNQNERSDSNRNEHDPQPPYQPRQRKRYHMHKGLRQDFLISVQSEEALDDCAFEH